MDRVQGASQEIPTEMNTRSDFTRGLALLWKGWSSILVQGEKSRRSQEQDYSISIPRGTTTHAGGKLLVAMRSAPHRVRGEAYCIGYIDASEHAYGVYQIHMKAAFFSGKLALSLLFVLDNNVFHEHGAWSALSSWSGSVEEPEVRKSYPKGRELADRSCWFLFSWFVHSMGPALQPQTRVVEPGDHRSV